MGGDGVVPKPNEHVACGGDGGYGIASPVHPTASTTTTHTASIRAATEPPLPLPRLRRLRCRAGRRDQQLDFSDFSLVVYSSYRELYLLK